LIILVPPSPAHMVSTMRAIAGSYDLDNSGFGFVDSPGTFTTIVDPLATGALGYTNVFGINNSGEVVGVFADSTGQVSGFLDDAGFSPPLPLLAPSLRM
jgi:hypothetical protein